MSLNTVCETFTASERICTSKDRITFSVWKKCLKKIQIHYGKTNTVLATFRKKKLKLRKINSNN